MNLKYLKETREGVRKRKEEKKHLHVSKKKLIFLIILSPNICFSPKVQAPQTQLLLSLITFLSEREANYQHLPQGTSLDLGWDSLGQRMICSTSLKTTVSPISKLKGTT